MISISNLTWQDGSGWGYQNMSLQVPFGEALILRGPNGSGKSTLLRLLAGLIESNLPPLEIPFHYVGHKLGLVENLSVNKNLEIFSHLFATAVRDDWNLQEIMNQKVRTLSKGQKQRVALSRLTMGVRPLWLLDEPTAGLDEEMKILFLSHLEKHLTKGGAVILALHEDIQLKAKTRILNLGRNVSEIPLAA